MNALSSLWSLLGTVLLLAVVLQTLLGWCGQRLRGWWPASLIAVAALWLARFPLGGLCTWHRIEGLQLNFSVPLTALLLHRFLTAAGTGPLLDRRALSGAWLFGLGAGLLLYASALGLVPFDLYARGWGSALHFVLLVLTLLLLWRRNRFGAVLLAAALAHTLRLVDSLNLWDYVVDPLFLVTSGAALLARALRRLRKREPEAA